MLPAKRKRRIVELVSNSDGWSVESLSDHLGYSKATTYRDLREFEDRGPIRWPHGRAVPVTSIGREQTYGREEVQGLEEKRAVTDRTVEELAEGQVMFFDAGTTAMEVAHRVPKDGAMLDIISSPWLVIELNEEDNEAELTGGTLRQWTKAFVELTTESFMERTSFDLLFLGTNALDVESDLTTPNGDEV